MATLTSGDSGLAALQECSQTQLGDPAGAGELHQISRLTQQMQDRWPDHPKLDQIRYSNAQSFEAEGYRIEAVRQYAKVSEASEYYSRAQLAAGRTLWAVAQAKERHDASDPEVEGVITTASRFLSRAIKTHEGQATATLIAGKLSRAQIHLRRGEPSLAIGLLERGDLPVIASAEDVDGLSEEFRTLAHETLFSCYALTGEHNKMQQALAELSRRYGPSGKERISTLQRGMATDYVKMLLNRNTIDANHVDQMETLLAVMSGGSSEIPLPTSLWLARSWSSLQPRAASEDIAQRCGQNAAAILDNLLADPQLGPSERLSIQISLIDAYRSAREYERALETVSLILRNKPNVIDLQLSAAKILRDQAAESPIASTYDRAISGDEGESIWGWQKLTNTLISIQVSDDDTASTSTDRTLESIYILNKLRLAQAALTEGQQDRKKMLGQVERQLNQVLSTIAHKDGPWREKLLELADQLK